MGKEQESKNQIDVNSEIKDIQNLDFQIKCEKDELVSLVSEKESEIDKLRKKRDKKLTHLVPKIRKGEVTSGDKFTDFAVVYLGIENSEEKENQLHDLENHLQQHKGEFALLKEIKHVAHGHIFMSDGKPHPELYHWEEKAYIGVISKEKPLDITMEQLSIYGRW